MSDRHPKEIEQWAEAQRQRTGPKRLFVDNLFDMIHRIAPDLPESTVWRLCAAIITVIAAEKGLDLS